MFITPTVIANIQAEMLIVTPFVSDAVGPERLCEFCMFEQRAVGFIDILGFKQLMDQAEASPAGFQRLAGLRAVLDNFVLYDNDGVPRTVPDALKPRYIFVSDSIILSAPLHHDRRDLADGLGIVVLKTIQIAERIIQLGHLVRGGISVGSVWHDQRNIFGTGYTSAYQTEQRAIHPRVVLDSAAVDVWRAPERLESGLCIPDGNDLVVDILHTYYLRETAAGIPYEGYFLTLRNRIVANLEDMPLGSHERSKWEWMVGFFNEALRRHDINVPQLTSLPIP